MSLERELREVTRVGTRECRRALKACDNDILKAMYWLNETKHNLGCIIDVYELELIFKYLDI